MRRQDIIIESSGDLQVSEKQDTYYWEIKEDLGEFYCFLLKKSTNVRNKLVDCFWILAVLK